MMLTTNRCPSRRALAIASVSLLKTLLSVKTGAAKGRLHAIPIKTHGRRASSLFALGLNMLRKILAAGSPDQIIVFLPQLLSPKLPVKPLLSLAF
jgi:hypothetical protein